MKTKTFNKKLTLVKKTITDLTNDEMDTVNGGAPASAISQCIKCGEFTIDICP